MSKRIISLFLLICILACTLSVGVFGDNKTYTIESAEDLIEFSKKCTLDTFSDGISAILECDIDLGGKEFSPIPTFGGKFEGNGHTVSGLSVTKAGSAMGLFRYVRSGAEVKNIIVSGSVKPDGTKSSVGGIAGENSGMITGCIFFGDVNGDSKVGGIAGENKDGGRISDSSFEGNINGSTFIGGITGKNGGLILNCENKGEISTKEEDDAFNISDIDIDLDSTFDDIIESEDKDKEEVFLSSHTDCGGICGYTTGIVSGCKNHGKVGYKHIGYNIGGIAGRQAGYILGCENFGEIMGKKDVGGIAGQTEPYFVLSEDKDGLTASLDSVDGEIDKLTNLINLFISETDSSVNDIDGQLKELSENARSAGDNAHTLLDKTSEFADDNLSEINAKAAVLSDAIDQSKDVFDSLSEASDTLSVALEELSDAAGTIKDVSVDMKDSYDTLQESLKQITKGFKGLSDASKGVGKALNLLENAISISDRAGAQQALEQLQKAFGEISDAKKAVKEALESLETLLTTKPESFKELIERIPQIVEQIRVIKDSFELSVKAIDKISDAILKLISVTNIEIVDIYEAVTKLTDAFYDIASAMKSFKTGVNDLSIAIEPLKDLFKDEGEGEFKTAFEKIESSARHLSDAADILTGAMDSVKSIADMISNAGPLKFVKLGDDYKEMGKSLFDSLSLVSDNIENIGNTVKSASGKMSARLTEISNQFNHIVKTLSNNARDISDSLDKIMSPDLGDIIEDVSEEEIYSAKQGKIENCINSGEVFADKNAGGIAGLMAIEHSLDPEDETEKPDGLNFTYKTKSILLNCVNDSKVTAKKECAGGVVGKMNMGTVFLCENYNTVESTEGNYAGGIAGMSKSSVRKSCSKSSAKGKKYVGGIAGYATTLSDCCAIAIPEGDEFVGAVAGDASNKATIKNCRFTECDAGGIDSISYNGKAHPITYDELRKIDGIPSRFISFRINFIVDGNIMESRDVEYGKSTSLISLPDIPDKEKEFGVWEDFKTDTVMGDIDLNAVYKPWVTTVSSEEYDGKLAVGLAEGKFKDGVILHITDSEEALPSNAPIGADCKVVEVKLINTSLGEKSKVDVRLLNKDGMDARVLQRTANGWQELETKERGKYVKFTMEGYHGTLCVIYGEKSMTMIFVIIGIMLLIALLVFLFIFIKRRRKKKLLEHSTDRLKLKI